MSNTWALQGKPCPASCSFCQEVKLAGEEGGCGVELGICRGDAYVGPGKISESRAAEKVWLPREGWRGPGVEAFKIPGA